jgi:hypothetical protein
VQQRVALGENKNSRSHPLVAVGPIGHPPNSDAPVQPATVHHIAIARPAQGGLDAFYRAHVAPDGVDLGEAASQLTAPHADGLVGGAHTRSPATHRHSMATASAFTSHTRLHLLPCRTHLRTCPSEPAAYTRLPSAPALPLRRRSRTRRHGRRGRPSGCVRRLRRPPPCPSPTP